MRLPQPHRPDIRVHNKSTIRQTLIGTSLSSLWTARERVISRPTDHFFVSPPPTRHTNTDACIHCVDPCSP